METIEKEVREENLPPMTIHRDEVEDYLNYKYEFRYNKITGKPEYRTNRDKGPFIAVEDIDLNSLYREMKQFKIKCSIPRLKSLLISYFCEIYNPFTKYLNNLPIWDGKTDYIDELASTVHTTNDTFWKKAFKKWIVTMVGSMLNDDTIESIICNSKQEFDEDKEEFNLYLDFKQILK